jgi:ribosomal 30S subunit maturation factor RimM
VLGTVHDVFFPGEGVAGTPLLEVDTPKGELMIPLAEDICTEIRVAERRIEVRLPDGLSELNAPE